jgi:carbonic anhydrase/acetyltransferase-like protein (isoleucine patch superfamily)
LIYELGERKPTLKGDHFVAPNAAVIGSVVMGHGASVWWSVTIRGDNDVITLGDNVNIQDGSVLHTDGKVIPDSSLVLGVNKVMRSLTPEEVEMNTWIADHYVERAGIYRKGLKPVG